MTGISNSNSIYLQIHSQEEKTGKKKKKLLNKNTVTTD